MSGTTLPGFGRAARPLFELEDGIAFLNHGSFGATPRPVREAQARWRAAMERQPVRFMGRELPPALAAARTAVARCLGAEPGNLVLVENATAGVNAVLRSLSLGPGDEILVTGLGYPAVQNAARFAAERSGARVVEAGIGLPIADAETIRAAVAALLSKRTRIALLDHVTSATACVMPLEALIADCRQAGVPVLIDGAHAPGMLPLDLGALGADWYTGNCHKWLFAPKGTAILHARPEHHERLHPLVISHGFGKGLQAEFDWPGTRDFSAWLALPDAIRFHQAPGPDAVRSHNARLAVDMGRMLAARWSTELAVPPALLGSMATVRLPLGGAATPDAALAVHDRLIDHYGVEVPVMAIDGRLWLRISAQIYNEPDDYERLAEAVLALRQAA